MKTANPIDAARIELLLADLRLPAIKLMWGKLAEQSDKEGWPAARFLAALAEHEIADRGRRRIERHLAEARLPVGKSLHRGPPFSPVRRAGGAPFFCFDGRPRIALQARSLMHLLPDQKSS